MWMGNGNAMRYENLETVKLNNCAVTLGKFDGLHAGHMQLINAITDMKKNEAEASHQMTCVVINLIKDGEDRFIISQDEKHRILEDAGVDVCIDIPMTKEFMSYDALEFLKDFLVDMLGMKYLAVGYDFCYGNGRRGTVNFLRDKQDEYGYELYIASKESRYGKRVSSTAIKEMLEKGEMEKVMDCLGRPYSVEGVVVHGNHLGRSLDMPTANIMWPEDKVMVAKGVYLSKVEIEMQEFFGITNVGTKPTVKWAYGANIETNIFDFDENIYGKKMKVSLLKHLRPEMKFESVDALKEQMHKDRSVGKSMVR